jgi:hypothetical protein
MLNEAAIFAAVVRCAPDKMALPEAVKMADRVVIELLGPTELKVEKGFHDGRDTMEVSTLPRRATLAMQQPKPEPYIAPDAPREPKTYEEARAMGLYPDEPPDLGPLSGPPMNPSMLKFPPPPADLLAPKDMCKLRGTDPCPS